MRCFGVAVTPVYLQDRVVTLGTVSPVAAQGDLIFVFHPEA